MSGEQYLPFRNLRSIVNRSVRQAENKTAEVRFVSYDGNALAAYPSQACN
jgi:hypothetical protein